MELHANLKIGGKQYQKGDFVPWYYVYPFFIVHMGAFGLSGFAMAYMNDGPDITFLYMHGGFACLIYVVFYVTIFGVDRVKWMFINAALGLFGIYAQLGWILAWFGKDAADFSIARHAIPFFYYVLYTFLLHQFLLDITGARNTEIRRKLVNGLYVGGSVLTYGTIWLSQA
ncbi:MAG: hypothetical protein AAF446_10315 [Pseudomonadota bacterium]